MSLSVANISAMRALPTTSFSFDIVNTVFVDTVGDFFRFVRGSALTPVSNSVVASSDGLGQWFRMGIPNSTFIQAKYWSVGSGGDDEARGWGATQADADAVKLATMKELNRRLAGFDGSVDGWYPGYWGPSIHLTSSVTANMFCVLTNLVGPPGRGFPRIYGDLVPVDSSATDRTLTGYQAAVTATNTERTLTISGIGSVPTYVAKAVVTTDGAKFAWVTRQPSSNVLALSQVRTYGTSLGSPAIEGGRGTISDFVNGEHVSFYDMYSIPDWPFSPDASFPILSRVRLANSDASYSAHGDMGKSSPYITQVIFGHPTAQLSYNLYGGDIDSGGQGYCIQPMFVGSHNTLHHATWALQSAACVSCTASPYLSDCNLAFYGELNVTTGDAPRPAGPSVNVLQFPQQNSAQIAMFNISYLYGAFSLADTDHHGGRADLYIDDGVKWYGSVAGAALAVASNANVRLPVSDIPLTCPGADLSGIGGVGTKQIIIFNVAATPVGKNFSDVPLYDTNSGVRISGHT